MNVTEMHFQILGKKLSSTWKKFFKDLKVNFQVLESFFVSFVRF